MNDDNVLKKEFSKKDVQRARNIVTGNTSARTTEGIGYTKKYEHHKEGDVWTEGGKDWTIKDGIKQTATKLDKVKKEAILPLFCPSCGGIMKKRNDVKMYNIHKKCFDCVIEHETQLKLEGKFDEYAININKQGILFHIKEMENILLELSLEQYSESFVTEAGDIETWKGKTDNTLLIEGIKEYILQLKGVIN